MKKYTIGIDFGSDSVRAIVADVNNGEIRSCGVEYYPRWRAGLYQHPGQEIYRQHPLDYLESMEVCVKKALEELDADEKLGIVGIGIDTTGSTLAPVNEEGTPLALLPEFADCEDAMFFLWKDHSAASEAEELNELFQNGSAIDYTKYQGAYSAEWFWAKILYAVRRNKAVYRNASTWVEHSDWIVGVLNGNTNPDTIYHNACAAGHKALYHSAWNGLPDGKLLSRADPYLTKVCKYYQREPLSAVVKTGTLTKEWAEKWGIGETVAVAGSSFDAHAGAVGAGICENVMVSILGTSAVDLMVGNAEDMKGKDIHAYGGQAENSILPGFVGIESGQAAFGDILAGFKRILMWPISKCMPYLKNKEEVEMLQKEMSEKMLSLLEQDAYGQEGKPMPIILDWFNGRRYPDTDDAQNSAATGMYLGMDAVTLYRALVFGAVAGLRRICDGFVSAGLKIDRLIAVGGISNKSRYVMQTMANVLEREILAADSEQVCALGAAIYGAVAAGCYDSMDRAIGHMASKTSTIYRPKENVLNFYRKKYQEYLRLAEMMEQEKDEVKKKEENNGSRIYQAS